MEEKLSSLEEQREELQKLIDENVGTDIIERIELVEKLIYPSPNEKLEIITSCEGSAGCQDEMISSTKS